MIVSSTGNRLLLKVRSNVPDVAIVDVRMPPDADAGLLAAAEIRRSHPTVFVLVLSQHLEPAYMLEVVGDKASGVGYLLKDRVPDVAEFVDAVERLAAGGTAFEPGVVSSLVAGRRRSLLDELSERERTVLSLIAEGRSNRAIERHVQAIFQTLGLADTEGDDGRVLAVLACSDAEHLADSRHAIVGRPPTDRRSAPSRYAPSAATLFPMALDLEALETSFDLVAPRGDELMDTFYARLFTAAPAVRPLFAGTDLRRQKAMLLGTLVLLRRSLRDLDAIVPKLRERGARHVAYGAQPGHYPVVGQALIGSMAHIAGDAWRPKYGRAWAAAFDLVAGAMLDGAASAQLADAA